jgi:hypothetical protein
MAVIGRMWQHKKAPLKPEIMEVEEADHRHIRTQQRQGRTFFGPKLYRQGQESLAIVYGYQTGEAYTKWMGERLPEFHFVRHHRAWEAPLSMDNYLAVRRAYEDWEIPVSRGVAEWLEGQKELT